MKKLISFNVLKANCAYLYLTNNECCNKYNDDKGCKSKNCPVWKKLETLPDKYIDGKPYWNIGGFREDRK